jgi:hypothetical protein
MGGNKQRRFTDEFKREAVRLIERSGQSVQQVASDLGGAKSTLAGGGMSTSKPIFSKVSMGMSPRSSHACARRMRSFGRTARF